MSRCSSCKAEIVWAWTGSGVRIPIDAAPVPDGNVEVTTIGDQWRVKVWGTADVWPEDTPRYRSHFATCPHAERYRRRR